MESNQKVINSLNKALEEIEKSRKRMKMELQHQSANLDQAKQTLKLVQQKEI